MRRTLIALTVAVGVLASAVTVTVAILITGAGRFVVDMLSIFAVGTL